MVIVQKKSSGTWWKCLLAFLGGFIFALAALAGGVAIAGTSVKLGTFLGANADQFLTAEYQNKTALDVVMGFINGNIKFNNLGDIAAITPFLDSTIEDLNKTLDKEIGFTIDVNELHTVSFSDIPDYVADVFKNGITLAGAMKIDSNSDPILQYLSFPKKEDGTYDYDNPYPLANFMDDQAFLNNLVQNATIGDLITPAEDNKLIKTISSWTISDLSSGDKIQTIHIGDIIEPEPGTLIDAIKDKTINDLNSMDAFDDIKISNIITIDDDSSPILKYLKDKTIGELKTEDLVGNMYIADIFSAEDINNSAILKALNSLPNPAHETDPSAPETGCKVSEIGERVNELKLEDVINCDVDSKIVQSLRHTKIGELSEQINYLVISDVMDYYVDPSTGNYYTNNTKATELSPVLVKLIGNEPHNHEYPGYKVTTSTWTINRAIDGKYYDYVVFNDDHDNKSDYYKIDEFIQNTAINISKHVEMVGGEEVVTWVASGSGTASPARDPNADSYNIEISWPTEWAEHYVNIRNKPTKINAFGDAVSGLKLRDVMTIEESSPFNNPKIKNVEITNAGTLFDVIKEELTIGDLVTHYEYPEDSGIYYSDEGHTQPLPQILNTFIADGVKLDQISGKMNTLTLGDVLSESERDSKFLGLIPATTKITEIGQAIDQIKVLDVFEDEIYDGSGNMKGTWKYLLIEDGEDKAYLSGDNKSDDPFNRSKYEYNESTHTGNEGTIVDGKYVFKCNAYTLGKSMGQMIDNMSSNMESATLYELDSDGILDLDDGFLDTTLPYILAPFAPAGKTKYGQFTIKEFTELISKIS